MTTAELIRIIKSELAFLHAHGLTENNLAFQANISEAYNLFTQEA